jgi:hypothetical protein
MRTSKWLACVLLVAAGAAISLTYGQQTPPAPENSSISLTATSRRPADRPAPDLSKLSPLQRQMYLAADRGANWLRRANRSDGHFDPGWVPALKTPLEGDHYLRQVGAAFALARAARILGSERYAAIARQSILTFLLDTAPDSGTPSARHTTLPSAVVNRLAAAGLLVLAINELPGPGDDLLEQSEQLCAYIRLQQKSDGSLDYSDADGQTEVDPQGILSFPGVALYALARSQFHRPADWKREVVAKALPYYRNWWTNHKSPAFIPWQSAAYAELYRQTQNRAALEFVFDMNDWLCGLHYARLDPRHPLWVGGFMEWTDGKPVLAPPRVNSAEFAEALAEANHAAQKAGDHDREQRYRGALESCLQFLTTLQYTQANTQHFAEWYKPVVLGGFYASHQDGNLRLDYTQHAVSALVQYLAYSGSDGVPKSTSP